LLGLAVIAVLSIGNPLPDGTRMLDVRPPAAPAAPPAGGGSFTVTTG